MKLPFLKGNICVLSIYRAPSGNFDYFLKGLDTILNFLHDTNLELILCGDININYLVDSNNKKQLDVLLSSFNLFSIVDFPTRIQSNSSSAIDNIFIDFHRLGNYTICPYINGLSDHDAQILYLNNIDLYTRNNGRHFVRNFSTTSRNEFLIQLSYETWDNVFVDQDIDIIFNSFLNTYLKIFNCTFPKKLVMNNTKHNPWMTRGIRISCHTKRELYLSMKTNSNPNLKSYFKTYSKVLSNVIRAAKNLYYNGLILNSINKTKTTWDIIKMVTGKRINNTEVHFLNVEGNLIDNHQLIVDSLNNYFLSVLKKINSNSAKSDHSVEFDTDKHRSYLTQAFPTPFPEMESKPATAKEIENIIRSLKPKKSNGYDEISVNILKASAPAIISPLTYICNRVLSGGVFPSRLKYSEIIPLFKTGDKTNMMNYRPISLLTSFSKVIEKVIFARLLNHIKDNKILSNHQYGFRCDSSSELAIYNLLNEILKALNNKILVGGIFCDLNKAFDCINHDVLLSKLKFYGIVGKTNALLESYLHGRYQRVVTNKKRTHSSWGKIASGVPQGSILGPLLFLLYINDLPNIIKSKSIPILFADDTSIIIRNSNRIEYENELNLIFKNISEWFKANSLTLNLDKTHFMHFSTKNSDTMDIPIIYRNNQIAKTDHIKFLGLMVDNTLSWKGHIDWLMSKLGSASYAIRAIKPYISLESTRSVYFSYFHSLMTYGLIFWGNSSLCIHIFRLQKRVIRIITNSRSRDSCRELFRKLKILPLCSQYIFSIVLFMVKNKDLFSSNSEIHTINTRHSNNLHYPSCNLTIFQKGTYYLGIKIFNKLPPSIKDQAQEIKKFKSAVKKFLFLNSFYSLNEYFNHENN
jgi:hypothetical protein